jgi:hypothetical protein
MKCGCGLAKLEFTYNDAVVGLSKYTKQEQIGLPDHFKDITPGEPNTVAKRRSYNKTKLDKTRNCCPNHQKST